MPQLSDKEKEVLSLAAQGFMTKEIADILNRTESTIETHRRALFRKLKATNMMEAVDYAMAYHLLEWQRADNQGKQQNRWAGGVSYTPPAHLLYRYRGG